MWARVRKCVCVCVYVPSLQIRHRLQILSIGRISFACSLNGLAVIVFVLREHSLWQRPSFLRTYVDHDAEGCFVLLRLRTR